MSELDATNNTSMQITDVGLVFNAEVPWDQWEKTGLDFKQFIEFYDKRVRWAVGDWILYGKNRFPDRYTQALEATMYTLGSLRNCEYVCSRIPIDRRSANLSFEHHYQVARLHPDDQDRLLSEAEKNGWTVAELRRACRGEYPVVRRAVQERVENTRRQTFSEWYDENEAALKSLCRTSPRDALQAAWNEAKRQ